MSEEAHAHQADRSIIDRNEAKTLASSDPNLAASQGDYNHEDHIGDLVDDDLGVGEALARLNGENS